MAFVDHIRSLVAYDRWANERVLDVAGRLTTDQLTAPSPGGYESVVGLLAHIAWAQTRWLSRWMGQPPPASPAPDRLRDLTVLRGVFVDVGDAFNHFVASLTDAALDRPLRYTSSSGKEYEDQLATLVLQVINHGTYHRGEIAAALTGFGHSPGDLDYHDFTLERDGRGSWS